MNSAVVLLSGGLDSATVLAIAKHENNKVTALSFDYGQRHRHELTAAQNIAENLHADQHIILNIDHRVVASSALTNPEITVPKHDPDLEGSEEQITSGDIPVTYVPARNTIFLAHALGLAESIGATDIFIGVNAVDYSGYPDCRPEFIAAFEKLANLATKEGVERRVGENAFRICAPLMSMTKSQIIQTGIRLGVDYSLTHSCYDPELETGAACGRCDSCILRRRGFQEAGVPDPTRYIDEI